MTADDLVLMLRDPEFMQGQDNASLERLVKNHPYFFIAYALLAKKNVAEPKRSQQLLHMAALQSGDREMLYHFMQEKPSGEISEEVAAPLKLKEWVLPELENKELMETLRSIHEHKQAILHSEGSSKQEEKIDSDGRDTIYRVPTVDEGEKEIPNQYELGQMSIADSEFSMKNISMDEENPEKEEEIPSLEISSINELESEMRGHTKVEFPEDLFIINEASAASAEFIPTEFLNSEDENEEFALEHDSEVDSIRVIEEEFILRDLDFDHREKEIEIISELELPLQVDAENLITPDSDDFSHAEIAASQFLEQEISDQQSFEQAEDIRVPELEPEHPMELQEEAEELAEREADDDSYLRINEYVQSPGEFLPEKSYTFSQWLKFFKYDKLSQKAVPGQTEEKKESSKFQTEERSFGTSMQQELESIDRIVSSLKYEPLTKSNEISAEELAKKSLELNEEIVSETLAEIYENQGKYTNAIRQYVKLSLLYPEKVSFFAARIKELKTKK